MKKLSILLIPIIAISFFSCNKDQNSENISATTKKNSVSGAKTLDAITSITPFVLLSYLGGENQITPTNPNGYALYNIGAYNNTGDNNYNVETWFVNTAIGTTFGDETQPNGSGLAYANVPLASGNYEAFFKYNSGPLAGSILNTYFTVYPQPGFTGTATTFPSNYASTKFEATIVPPQGNSTQIFRSLTPILTVGQSLYSPNGLTELKLQADGNLVLYVHNADGSKTGIWASNTVGKASASLTFQPDGNLVIKNSSGTGLWASNINSDDAAFKTQTSNAPYYNLQNDGGFVLYWPEHYAVNGPAEESSCYVITASADATVGHPSAHSGNLNHVFTYTASGIPEVAANSFVLAGSGFLSN